MIDRNRLRTLAQAATPGPWEAGRMDMVSYDGTGDGGPYKNIYVDDPNGKWHMGHQLPKTVARGEGDEDECRHNAAFIAAANPSAVLEILDALDRAVELLRHCVQHCDCEGRPVRAFLASLEGTTK